MYLTGTNSCVRGKSYFSCGFSANGRVFLLWDRVLKGIMILAVRISGSLLTSNLTANDIKYSEKSFYPTKGFLWFLSITPLTANLKPET